jgi:hypothetical protein
MISDNPIEIRVGDLKSGDKIADDSVFGGFATVVHVSQELGRDLNPWIAVRTMGGGIKAFDSWESAVTVRVETDRPRQDDPFAGLPEFVPPKAMADLMQAALAHRRAFIVSPQAANSGDPYVTLTVQWRPHGCDVATKLELTWHTFGTGTYRFRSGLASGYRRYCQPVTIKAAKRLITGEDCFWRPYAPDQAA